MDEKFLQDIMSHKSVGELFEKVLEDQEHGDKAERLEKCVHFIGFALDMIDLRIRAYSEAADIRLKGEKHPDRGVLDHIQKTFRKKLISDLEDLIQDEDDSSSSDSDDDESSEE